MSLLRESDTYTARLWLYPHEKLDFESGSFIKREGRPGEWLALVTLSMEEDVPRPMLSAVRQQSRSESIKTFIGQFYERVEAGDPKYVEAAAIMAEYRSF